MAVGHRRETVQDKAEKRMFTSAIRDVLRQKIRDRDGTASTYAYKMAKRICDIALKGPDKAAVLAMREIADRTEGKAAQRIDIAGIPEMPVQMITREMTDAEAARIVNSMLRRPK